MASALQELKQQAKQQANEEERIANIKKAFIMDVKKLDRYKTWNNFYEKKQRLLKSYKKEKKTPENYAAFCKQLKQYRDVMILLTNNINNGKYDHLYDEEFEELRQHHNEQQQLKQLMRKKKDRKKSSKKKKRKGRVAC
jgi:hypothetical protein